MHLHIHIHVPACTHMRRCAGQVYPAAPDPEGARPGRRHPSCHASWLMTRVVLHGRRHIYIYVYIYFRMGTSLPATSSSAKTLPSTGGRSTCARTSAPPGQTGLTPTHICAGTDWARASPISTPLLRSHLPHLRRDWAHPAHIRVGTGPTPAHICAGTNGGHARLCGHQAERTPDGPRRNRREDAERSPHRPRHGTGPIGLCVCVCSCALFSATTATTSRASSTPPTASS